MAAPPVMVFDTAGNFIKAWGGAGSGFEWPEREHGIHIDYKGFVWIGGNSCPSDGLPGLKPFGNKPVDDDHCEVVSPKTFTDSRGPANFNIVHAIRVANSDGTVYVADRENRRVQMFLPDGTFVKQLIRTDIPFAKDLALSPDREQQFLYVGGGKGIMAVDRKTLDVVGTIQPPGIIGTGHHIATDSKGNIYIAQPSQGMQKLTFKGMSTAGR
jgi:DNA-binding beta-propeller fold protein YncE